VRECWWSKGPGLLPRPGTPCGLKGGCLETATARSVDFLELSKKNFGWARWRKGNPTMQCDVSHRGVIVYGAESFDGAA
jgi:hypothetical protein